MRCRMKRLLTSCASLLVALAGALTLSACDPARVFEDNHDFPEGAWLATEKPVFAFTITDTAARYTVRLNVRNSVNYQFYNLFAALTLRDPTGQVRARQLHEMVLLDKATGQPLGDGLGDLFDHQFVALRHVRFTRPGTYRAEVSQYMRLPVLPELLSVGIRVEREEKK